MIRGSKGILTGVLLAVVVFIVITVVQGFYRVDDIMVDLKDFTQKVSSFQGPDSLSFAGERVPMENYDTRESYDREINTISYRHSSTFLIIKRANRYFPVIEPILKEYGIPDDFKYLAVAESELSNAVSPAGAKGYWQFMKSTGKEYGLEINDEIDERYNLEKATSAACRYFLKSYEKYGNWTMVAASYNLGSSGLDRLAGIQQVNNYYDLLLPEETARYIFRILSFKTIFNNPREYGYYIPGSHLYPSIEYYTVSVDTAVSSFALFAREYSTNYKMLKDLNPWLRQPYLTNRKGKEYFIKVPAINSRTGAYSDK